MGAPVIRSGGATDVTGSGTSVIMEFEPRSDVAWRSTVVTAYQAIAQPNTVGGGAGQSLGTYTMQVNRANVCEFRLLDTYYGIAGGAVLIIPLGDMTFLAGEAVRWLMDASAGTVSGAYHSSASFFGVTT